jgi:hypothetical protein
MAKNKVSEWNSNPASNTDVGGVDIAEGCAPSGINNAIREVMAQVKDMQAGLDGDNFTVGGNLSVTGTSLFTGVATFSELPVITGAGVIPSGGIIIWSGSSASIPSGWYLCNGSNGTPDLRNRFIVGAGSTYAVGATGGSANATLVSHTHTVGTTSLTGSVNGISQSFLEGGTASGVFSKQGGNPQANTPIQSDTNDCGAFTMNASHTHTLSTEGSSATNANLPPYYALCYIMKS